MNTKYTLNYASKSQADVSIYEGNKELNVKETLGVITTLEARNAQLLEALTLAHSILLHEMDNGRTPTQLQGVGLGYFEDVIEGLDDAQFRRG